MIVERACTCLNLEIHKRAGLSKKLFALSPDELRDLFCNKFYHAPLDKDIKMVWDATVSVSDVLGYNTYNYYTGLKEATADFADILRFTSTILVGLLFACLFKKDMETGEAIEDQFSKLLPCFHTIQNMRGVIHRDVKSSNILLDENWAAMISDFGLSKIGPIDQASNNISVSVKGTFGYLDPEYFYTSKLTRKTGMYAFGVVLFELLSGKLAVDTRLEEQGTFAPNVLRGFAEIANRCLIRDFEKRPSMTQVVAKLQDLLELQEKCDNSKIRPGHRDRHLG
ncbi:receptor-like protein kinase FERONIA [Tanacetum coccineum]|uniref:Receptor-like protein kinase FERONIA n=1 Tax=Tanacetum coccineum TaxID=301880 RepID=A0ABQ5FDU3_9ASTR